MITFVYANDENGGIGVANKMPWDLPKDLEHFKEVTMGHTMVMGRKTFESIDQRLLPGRETVVLTQDPDYGRDIPGLKLVHSQQEVLDLAQDQELMIVGGARVFVDFMPYADKIVRTIVHGVFDADTKMPDINPTDFRLVKEEFGEIDEENPVARTYQWWERIKK